jgi:hypothetical protein
MIFVGVLIAAIPVVGEGWFPVVHRSPFATLLIYVVLPIGAVFFATWPAAYALILARAVRLGVVCEADVVGRTADGGPLGIWWCPTLKERFGRGSTRNRCGPIESAPERRSSHL